MTDHEETYGMDGGLPTVEAEAQANFEGMLARKSREEFAAVYRRLHDFVRVELLASDITGKVQGRDLLNSLFATMWEFETSAEGGSE